jgi:hypothetical protein
MNSDERKKGIDLTDFACRLLKAKGAILEPYKDAMEVLLPTELARYLETPELISLISEEAQETKSSKKDQYHIQFQSFFLEKLLSLVSSKKPLVIVGLKFDYIKTGGFERLIQEQFNWIRTKIRLCGTGEMMTRYLILTCRYKAGSDELKEGLLNFCFNLDTGAMVQNMLEPLYYMQKEYHNRKISICSPSEIEKIQKLILKHGLAMIENELADFINSMNRRFKRDSISLEEYYNGLAEEMEAGLKSTRLSEKAVQERQEKLALIPDELKAKKEDLLNKYSIKINFEPVAAIAISSPCIKILAEILSGRQKSTISIIYNPVIKQLDPIVCRSCGDSTYSAGCCDKMHINCPDCLKNGCMVCNGKDVVKKHH